MKTQEQKSEAKPSKPLSNYEVQLRRLRGFCDGAGCKPIRPDEEKDMHYTKGYADGQRAKHDYAKTVASELGVELHRIVLL